MISNGQLVSVNPANALTRAAIGLLSDPSTVHLDEEQFPLEFSLGQNYPNPFNPSTVIRYRIPESTGVRLDVYDILGRRVVSLVNEQLAAGEHTAVFDGSRLASGVYLYRLQAGNRTMVRKMLLVK
ncbi:MAG: T9SS C-terminal target domain-containing protein [Balneolaceae bacterium]|nr:MAG: T9SS C-terminal target domain-containing protein [Balneolaceae bacterium]